MPRPRFLALTGTALAALTLTLSGCGGALDTGVSSETDSASGEIPRPEACDSDSPLIAVALPNLTNPYYVAMKKGFEEQAKQAGFTTDIQIADDDDAQQLSQVQAMLQKKPCALALNAVKSDPAAAIVKAANDAKVPVFTVNVIVSEEALQSQSASIVQYLGADNVAGGKQIAEQVLKDLGADSALKVGFVTEPDEKPTLLRDQGFEDAIKTDANAKVVARVDGNVKPDDSLKVTTELLSGNPDLNVIYANTGPGVYGALQGLGSNKDVSLYGFCADRQPLKGQYKACVAQEPEKYGQEVINQIQGWLKGATPEKEVLKQLKLFTSGQTPGAGEVG